MGAILGKFRWKNEARILLLGLDAAGKTTMLYRAKLGEVVTTIPTIGFNVETIQHGGLSITAWDIGGRDKMRPLFRHYFANTDAIIYVIDSNDVERIDDAREELHRFLREDELRDAVVLVVANKQDLPNARSPVTLSEELQLFQIKHHRCNIIPTVATTGDGLNEVFEWLHQAIVEQRRGVSSYVKTITDVNSTVSVPKQTDTSVAQSPSMSARLSKTWEIFKSLFIAQS